MNHFFVQNKLKLLTSLVVCNFLASSPLLATESLSKDLFGIDTALDTFAKAHQKPEVNPMPASHGNPKVSVLELDTHGSKRTFYGIHTQDLQAVDYGQLKQQLAQNMGTQGIQLVQIVGDSNKFSEAGTIAGRAFLEPHFSSAQILEYGFTGYLDADRKRLDINSFLNEWVENDPSRASKVVASVVGHSVVALDKWGCRVTDKLKHFVVVYNDNGTSEGFTTFGADVYASDNILRAEDGDYLVILDGGPQSFTQATNVMANGVMIKVLFNLRSDDNQGFFSAGEFFSLVQDALKSNPSLSQEGVKQILSEYLVDHKAWDAKRNDASTKEKLFYGTVEKFIGQNIYQKLLNLADIQKFHS